VKDRTSESQARRAAIQALIETSERVAKLFKAALKDSPPTDIKADALEACDRVLELAAKARG
jgi:ribosomal protein S12 methylthiotransferase accessory factor YcaO